MARLWAGVDSNNREIEPRRLSCPAMSDLPTDRTVHCSGDCRITASNVMAPDG